MYGFVISIALIGTETKLQALKGGSLLHIHFKQSIDNSCVRTTFFRSWIIALMYDVRGSSYWPKETSSAHHSFKQRSNCEHARSSVLDLAPEEALVRGGRRGRKSIEVLFLRSSKFSEITCEPPRNRFLLSKRFLCRSTSRVPAIFGIPSPHAWLSSLTFVKFSYRSRAVEFRWMHAMRPDPLQHTKLFEQRHPVCTNTRSFYLLSERNTILVTRLYLWSQPAIPITDRC